MVDHAPIPLLTHAHEVFLAVAVFFIGAGLLAGDVRPGSVSESVPDWINTGWAWFLFTGSCLTLWGLFQHRPRMEWAGQMLLGWGCFFYTWAIALNISLAQGGVVTVIFGGLSVVSWWRAWKITNAAPIQARLAVESLAAGRRIVNERGDRRG